MKKIDLGQIITIVANLGVIAGIFFLAVEMRQNNEALAAQSRLGQLAAETSRIAMSLNNPELAHINFKAMSGQTLTPEERNTYFEYALFTMMHWRWEYEEYMAGTLPVLNVDAWRVQAGFSPVWREAWDATLGSRDTAFARFVNENVFSD